MTNEIIVKGLRKKNARKRPLRLTMDRADKADPPGPNRETGMDDKRRLTEWCSRVIMGEDEEQALTKSGFNGDVDHALNHPSFISAMIVATHTRMSRKIVPKCLPVIEQLIDSDNEKVQLSAVKWVMDKVVPNVVDPMIDEKDMSDNEISVAELRLLVDQLEGHLAYNATEVSNADDPAPVMTNPLSFMQ